MMKKKKMLIGWREWISLPDLGIPAIKAKVDTGARTSSLHTFNLKTYEKQGKLWVRFGIHPLQHNKEIAMYCDAEVQDQRLIRNTGGKQEKRYIIRSRLQLGDEEWPIEISLSKRDNMLFRMLLGRTALRKRVKIDPDKSYWTGLKLADAYENPMQTKKKEAQ